MFQRSVVNVLHDPYSEGIRLYNKGMKALKKQKFDDASSLFDGANNCLQRFVYQNSDPNFIRDNHSANCKTPNAYMLLGEIASVEAELLDHNKADTDVVQNKIIRAIDFYKKAMYMYNPLSIISIKKDDRREIKQTIEILEIALKDLEAKQVNRIDYTPRP